MSSDIGVGKPPTRLPATPPCDVGRLAAAAGVSGPRPRRHAGAFLQRYRKPSDGVERHGVQKCGRDSETASERRPTLTFKEIIVGKYAIAWLLGVPGVVLVLVYLLMH